MGHHGYTIGAQDADSGWLQVGNGLPFVNAITAKLGTHGAGGPAGDEHHNLVYGASPDAGRVRAPDGLAGRLDGGGELVRTLRVGAQRNEDGGPGDTVPIIVQSLDTKRGGPDDNEAQAGHLTVGGGTVTDDPLLPLGLDSHRYRCCGNGVVSQVAEWIGWRLREALP